MQRTFSHQLLIRNARLWLCGVFFLLRAGDYLFWKFAFAPLNPAPVLRGMVFAGAMCTTILIVAMWLRRAWSRYVLCTIIVLMIAGLAMPVLVMLGGTVPSGPNMKAWAAGAIMLYSIALVPLASARSIHHIMKPLTSGGD
jgi:hypothetical protein